MALTAGGSAFAEVWGYVDAGGHPHVAATRVDERYQLFFRGAATPDAPPVAAPSVSDTAGSTEPSVTATRFEGLIEHHAASLRVDPALVKAIVAVESGFQPTAVSPKGARGLMQVLPETAARYGVTTDRRRSAEQKLMDPAVNLQVGTRYLRDLLERFAQNVTLAVAAYNAGEMAVERHRNQVPPYPETVEYVRRVQRLYAAFRPAVQAAAVAVTPSSAGRVHGTLRPRAAALSAQAVAAGTNGPEPVL